MLSCGYGEAVVHPRDRAKLKRQLPTGVDDVTPLTKSFEANSGVQDGFKTRLTEPSLIEFRREEVEPGASMQLLRSQSVVNDPRVAMTQVGDAAVSTATDFFAPHPQPHLPPAQALHNMHAIPAFTHASPQVSGQSLEPRNKEEEKKRLKRAANRKSAYTSRARKKQYVEEMTVANRDLKHHAHILDLLPDLIIGVDRNEKISFVSRSVSRKLQYDSKALVGASIYDVVTADTRRVIASVLRRKFSDRRQDGAMRCQSGGSSDGSTPSYGRSKGRSTQARGEIRRGGEQALDEAPLEVGHMSGRCIKNLPKDGQVKVGPAVALVSDSSAASVASTRSTESLLATTSSATNSSSGGSVAGSSNPEDAESTCSTSSDELALGKTKAQRPSAMYDAEGEGEEGTFAKWSHVNLQRHNQEIDQQNEQAIWALCLVRRDRTTLWCEANSNVHAPGGSADLRKDSAVPVELVFSLRPVRDGDPVPPSFKVLSSKSSRARQKDKDSRAKKTRKSSSRKPRAAEGSKLGPKAVAAGGHATVPLPGKSPSVSGTVKVSSCGQADSSLKKKTMLGTEKTSAVVPAIVESDLSAAETLLGLMGK